MEGKLEPDGDGMGRRTGETLGRSRETWRALFEVDDTVGDVD